MTDKKTFRQMTDDEIRWELRHIAIGCQYSDDPKAAFNARVKEELECPYTVVISFSDPNGAGQRMWMGMVNSPTSGEVINF